MWVKTEEKLQFSQLEPTGKYFTEANKEDIANPGSGSLRRVCSVWSVVVDPVANLSLCGRASLSCVLPVVVSVCVYWRWFGEHDAFVLAPRAKA